MANYYGTGRSNYFRVKDIEAFKSFCKRWNLEPWEVQRNTPRGQETLVGFAAKCETGSISSPSEETDDASPFDELKKLLLEDEVIIFMSAGNEKLRYVHAYAIAMNSFGKVRHLGLDDIYKKAKKLTKNPKGITRCEY